MRDPDLVLRAEHAANALEQAWLRWRARHGLEAGPLPPVSSYVGYSLEEPWGQPRVVFGIGAMEAERLAAILDSHDRAGPVHAGMAIRPEPRYADAAPAAWTIPGGAIAAPGGAAAAERMPARAVPSPPAGSIRFAAAPAVPVPAPAVPAARVPAAYDRPASGQPAYDQAGTVAAGPVQTAGELAADDLAVDDLTAEQTIVPRVLRQAAALADQPADLPADTAARLGELAARPAGYEVPDPPPAEGPDSESEPLGVPAARPGIVAFRPQPAPELSRDPVPPDDDGAWIWSGADAAQQEARTA